MRFKCVLCIRSENWIFGVMDIWGQSGLTPNICSYVFNSRLLAGIGTSALDVTTSGLPKF